MAYDAKVNYADVFYQVRMWDNIIYNYLKRKNVVVPPKKGAKKDENTQVPTSRNRFLESMIGWLI